MKEIKMNVNGIMCNNCVSKINTALSVMKGCLSSVVSEDYSTVIVKYNEDLLLADQIIDTIESIKEKSFHVTNKEEIIS